MEKIKAAIVGYGNIGRYVLEALETAPDFEVAGIVRRNGDADCPKELQGYKIVRKISELGKPDVAILAVPSRKTEEYATEILQLGINTVDSFDIHTLIPETRKRLQQVAAAAGKVAVISAGWDPGSDSIVRALMQAMAPKGLSYTNFGPGMSMGHSVAVKAVPGGANINLNGTFAVVYNANAEVIYALRWGIVGSIASIDGFSWNADVPMNLGADGKWYSSPVALTTADEFKLRENAGWDVNRGGTCAAVEEAFGVENNGANIQAPADGTYIVIYDPATETITLSKNFWGAIGDFNEWSGDVFLVCQGNDQWAA